MIVDASAFIAVFFEEDDNTLFDEKIAYAPVVRMSVASYVEIGIRVDRTKNVQNIRRVDYMLNKMNVKLEPITPEQAHIARAALRDYGRGTGHPARLNFGDSFSYALAKVYDEPLLFKGDDFVHTDVINAMDKA